MSTKLFPPASQLEFLTHTKYRPDIDGLRAIAVLAVVIFHAFPNALKGGFVGVDIFFVISGFLISTIILNGLELGTFRFTDFYSRRIKRIFPALFLVLIASLCFGWFTLLADEYKQLGKHVAGGAGFISNFLFWREASYFDNAADTKPLLHLWSLGIEEQFYIVWPVLLWAAYRKRFNLATLVFILLILSFALNIAQVQTNAVATFYLLPTRAWELLLGSVLAQLTLHPPNLPDCLKNVFLKSEVGLAQIIYHPTAVARGNQVKIGTTLRDVASMVGAVLLLISITVATKDLSFPGWWATLPTLGVVLIIAAGAQAWFNRTVLANRGLVGLGLISFPLYLWHWPLLSFARIIESETPSRGIRLAAIGISLVLAWLTYKLIERPIRFGKHRVTLFLLILMVGVGGAGFVVREMDGVGDRSSVLAREEFASYVANTFSAGKYFKNECNYYDIEKPRAGLASTQVPKEINPNCYEKDFSKNKIIFIWGDSHAQQLNYGISQNLPNTWQVLQVASSSCNARVDVIQPSATQYCEQSNWRALKTVREIKPDVVVIAQHAGHTVENFDVIAKALQSIGIKKIIFTGPVPHWKAALPKIIVRNLWITKPSRTTIGLDATFLTLNQHLKASFPKISATYYADLMGVLCNERGCLTRIGDNAKTGITSWDSDHLTPMTSDYVSKNLLMPLILSE